MKFLSCLVLSALLISSPLLQAQEDPSELEELEKELDTIEAEDTGEVTEKPDFTEKENPEDLGTLETEDLEDVLEENEEDVADQPQAPSDVEQTEDAPATVPESEQNADTPTEPIEVPTDELLDTPPPEEIATPTDDSITIPGSEDDATQPSEQADLKPPEMLTPLEDEPNANKERSIFNAYQYIKNYSKLDEAWPQASQGREAESYGVQAGDSLWDISLTLFGNPYFWPKIWQINSSITNPHDIKPGDPLVFIEGNLQAAPQLSQGEAPAGDEMPPEEELLADVPELPETEQQQPTLQEIPPSLAAWHLTTKADDNYAADEITKIANRVPNVIRLSSYIVEELPKEQGKIIEIELGSDAANLYQNVFIESDEIGVGDILVSYEMRNKVHDEKGKLIAYSIQLAGTLKVTEVVATEKNIFKAFVTYLANPILKGSFVKKGSYPIKTINDQAPTVSIDTEIIGAEYDNKRRVLGTGTIVYLSSGADAGIQEGNALQIVKNQQARNKKTLVENNTNVIGKVQILDVQPRFSTGVIVKATENIAVGDTTGASTVLSYDAKEPEVETSFEDEEEIIDEPSANDKEIEDELELLDE